jgi:PAS domain S-box-containing protein/diguanylate cyclase (GGDEF)-like protein
MFNILFNIALLLALTIFFATYPFRDLKRLTSHKVLVGVTIGVVGILVMLNPLTLYEGVIFDSSTILLTVSGMVFGLLPTAIGAAMMAIYRLMIGGGGIYTGLTTILLSSVIGVWWHKKRYQKVLKKHEHFGLEYYLIGVITHVGMLLAMLLMPSDIRRTVVAVMAFPVLVIYPVGTYLLSLLLFSQARRVVSLTELEKSERLFKTMFEEAPIGMSLTDLETGRIENINQSYSDMLGYTKEELLGRTWEDFTHPEDKELSKAATASLHEQTNGPLSLDKRFIRKDGQILWANLSLSVFTTRDTKKTESLCMTVDITERKHHEQKILYASNHDALTGLYNRVHFEEYVRDMRIPDDQVLTIAFGDVNGLRILNEAFGREEGNRLLVRIARILQRHLSQDDYVSRVGGDEFALFFFQRTPDQIETILGKVAVDIASLEMMGSVVPSMSFGLSSLSASRGNINEAIKQAEKDLATRKLVDSPHTQGKAVYAIINTLHEKNKREENHSRRVSELCERLAKAYGMGDMAASELRLVGLLHDIGKIAIPESILNKEGRLTAEEWKEMKRHAEIGYRILNSVEDMAGLAQYVLAHHEHYDGNGYPKGLKGEEIPLQSRIICIADAYDAMTASRPYRKTVTAEQAASEIKRCSRTQFDPALVKVFIEDVLALDYEGV